MSSQPNYKNNNQKQQPAPQIPNVPFSTEAEEAFLGGILVNPKGMNVHRHKVFVDDFFILRHGHIWDALCWLYDANQSIDYLTLNERLSEMKLIDAIGGQSYVIQLINNTPTSAHTDAYAGILSALSERRKLIAVGDQIKALAVNETITSTEALTQAQTALGSIKSYADGLAYSAEELGYEYEQALATNDDRQYFSLGFGNLDKFLKPARKTLTVVGGRVGTGKTAFCMNTALYHAKLGRRCLFLAVESTPAQLRARFLSIMTGYATELIEQPSRMTAEQKQVVTGALQYFKALPISIRTEGSLTAGKVALLTATERHMRGEVTFVFIDGLYDMELDEIISASGRPRPQLANATRKDIYNKIQLALIEMAKEENVVIVMTHQLNRMAENNVPDKTIYLEDGGDRNADAVIMLHRLHALNKRDDPRRIDAHIVKARGMGRRGIAELMYDENCSLYYQGDPSVPPSMDDQDLSNMIF